MSTDPLRDLFSTNQADPLAGLFPPKKGVPFVPTGYRKRTVAEERRANESMRKISMKPTAAKPEFGTVKEVVARTEFAFRDIPRATVSGETIDVPLGRLKVPVPVALVEALQTASFGSQTIEAALTNGRGYRSVFREHGLPDTGSFGPAAVAAAIAAGVLDPINLLFMGAGALTTTGRRALQEARTIHAVQRGDFTRSPRPIIEPATETATLARAAQQEALRSTLPASRGGTAREITLPAATDHLRDLFPVGKEAPTPTPGIRQPVPVELPRPSVVRPTMPEVGSQVILSRDGNTYRVGHIGPRGMTLIDVQTGQRRISPVLPEEVRVIPKEEAARTPSVGRVIPEQPQVAQRLQLTGQEAVPLPPGQQKGLFGERPEVGAFRAKPQFGGRNPEEMTLAEFVRFKGGIKPEGDLRGEILAFSKKEAGTTGLVNAKSGLSPSRMAEAAADAGFPIGHGEGAELLSKLREDFGGRTVLSAKSVTRIEQEVERKYRKALQGLGALDYLGEESGAVRAGLALESSPSGRITLLRPPKDLNPVSKWLGSPSKIFQLDPSAAQIHRRAEMFEVAKKRETARLLITRQRVTKGLTNPQKVNVLQALDGQTIEGQKIGDIGAYLSKLTEQERGAYTTIRRDILDELGTRFRQRGQLGVGVTDYFPHIFRGRWKLTIEDAPEATRFFETSGDAITEARKILDITPQANVVVALEGYAFPEEVATLLSRKGYFRLVSQLQKAIGKDVMSKDNIIRATRGVAGIKHPKERFFGHLQPRIANLQTFDHDLDRALDTYIVGAVKKLETDAFRADAAKLRGAINPDLRNMLREVDDYIDDVTGLPGASEAVLDDWLVRVLGVRERPTRRWSAGTAGVVAKLKLGYNPISAMVNLSQTATNTYPVLGGKWTAIGVQGAVDHFRLGTQSKHAQVIDALGVRFFDSKAFGTDLVPLTSDSPLQAMYMFNRAEEVNRVVAAIGAYERGINELTLLPAEAIEHAQGLLRRTQFTYDASDLPKLLRNPFGRVLGQFRAYTIKELEFIHSLRGVEIPRFVIAAAVTGSLVITPHVLAVNAIVKKATGKDFLADFRERFPRLVRGLPALLGIDLSERIGIGSDIEFTVDKPERLLGPGVGTVTEITRAASRYTDSPSEDNAYGLIRALAPTQFRYLLQAYQAAQRKAGAAPGEVKRVLETAMREGGTLTGFRGRPITSLSPQELKFKAIGFRTMREGQIREAVERAREREEEVQSLRTNALDHAVSLRAQGRPWSHIIRETNKKLPAGSRLTIEDVERAAAIRRRHLLDRTMQNLPKGLRPEFRHRFQNLEPNP